MLASAEAIGIVASALRRFGISQSVVDPVCIQLFLTYTTCKKSID
jgi:hydroxymethylpyrimidine/phosphomethylpyrimidine kinase